MLLEGVGLSDGDSQPPISPQVSEGDGGSDVGGADVVGASVVGRLVTGRVRRSRGSTRCCVA